ncbi:MAG: cryptochrome/photolyase family protein [Candidatus Pelagibacterales bacterium]|tara:strand:- start:205 stop:1695 length:1491 start_codon:yes stop_codon:yes gene_type:complete
MSKEAFIVLGNQLFPLNHIQDFKSCHFFMAEDYDLCTYFKFHKHKLIFYLSAMREYKDALIKNKYKCTYCKLDGQKINHKYEDKLELFINKNKIKKLKIFEIPDSFFRNRIVNFCKKKNIDLEIIQSPMFMSDRALLKEYFEKNKKPFLINFYKLQRINQNILIKNNLPTGGKWSFDEDNRKKLPKNIQIPPIKLPSENKNIKDVKILIDEKFKKHPGNISGFLIPTNRETALNWLQSFFKDRFKNFGDYEDALTTESNLVFHSLLSPLLNIGLLVPSEVIQEALKYHKKNKIPLNSFEGFIRQILGWREFIKGTYDKYENQMVKGNFWNHKRKLTSSWYTGTTGIDPLDHFIKEVNACGYTHHIPRLMVISNIMNLAGIHPKEIYRWFMEMFVDSSDWVMVPNVFSMGTFSDGGIFATKPYICGSNYILKMSNFKKGEWCDIVDGLYWSFIERNMSEIKKNYRMSMMANAYKKISEERKKTIFTKANKFIKNNSN